jgi:hypothetical protein
MYSDGAINSMVEDFISGLLVGSPYVLLTGSYWNSSGTVEVKLNLLYAVLYYAFNNHKRSHMVENVPFNTFSINLHFCIDSFCVIYGH